MGIILSLVPMKLLSQLDTSLSIHKTQLMNVKGKLRMNCVELYRASAIANNLKLPEDIFPK
jgi:hypothetical protein